MCRSSSPWRSGLIWITVAVALLAGGCGFHLRGDYALPDRISPVRVTGVDRFSGLYRQLERAFRSSGVAVTRDTQSARAVLELSGYTGGRFVTALDDEGKAAEYELSRQVGFVLKDRATQNVLVPYRQLDSERLYSLEPDTGFGKTLERREIEDELDAELVDRILLAISLGLR
jgi:LPS-assembly lipoprotein